MRDAFVELKRHIEQKKEPFAVLTGEEYSIQNAKDFVEGYFKGYTSQSFFLENAEMLTISLKSQGIFGDKKLLVVYYPERFPGKVKKELVDRIFSRKIPGGIFLLIITEKPEMFKKKGVSVIKFRSIYSSEVDSWIREYVYSKGKSITDEAVYMLKLIFGKDRLGISNLMDVLISMPENLITSQMIRSIKNRDSAVFDMVESVFAGKRREAIESFIISGRETHAYSFLERDTFLTIVVSKGGKDTVRAMNLRDYVLKKYRRRSSLGFQKLKDMFVNAIEWDFSVKRGLKPFETGILYLYKTTQGGKYGNE